MRSAYTVEQIRTAEQEAFAVVGEDALMQHAAAAVAVTAARELRVTGGVYGGRVLVLAGGGNNGGDGLFAAAHLAARGARVQLVRTSGRVHEAGWTAARAAGVREVDDATALALIRTGSPDIVIDAVLGIGGRPGLREPATALARACADTAATVVAVDLPSGLAADAVTVPADAFRATVTVTLGGNKVCHLAEPARTACGRIETIDIGLDLPGPALRCWEVDDLAAAWPVPGPASDKYGRGVVGIDTGSDAYPGAAILSTSGAVHAGAGMVRYLGAGRAAELMSPILPNVVRADGRVQSWLLGSGWGERPDGTARVAAALDTGLPLLLDADALRYLPEKVHPRVVLTPHAGELARLLGVERGEIEADPLTAVRATANRTGATVLLKGASQYVATPGGRVTLALPGPAWTATAGSGDTLAGICAALLAAGLDAERAALAGASVQALAARDRPGPVPPQELAATIADAVRHHLLTLAPLSSAG